MVAVLTCGDSASFNMTDWEQLYQEGTTPWDKGAGSPPLVDYLATSHGWDGGRILVPGCGQGHDVRVIAAACPEAEVVGLDLAPSAVDLAKSFPKTGQESYLLADWFALDEAAEEDKFDVVWEHTCFCAIDQNRRDDHVAAAARSLRAGGELVGVFYLNPYDEEHTPGEGPPHGVEKEELVERFSRRFDIIDQWCPENTYPGREGLEWMMRMQVR